MEGGLSVTVSHPSSSSRSVLHEQHSDMKIGLCGSAAWHASSWLLSRCEKPCTSMLRNSRPPKVNMLPKVGREPSHFRTASANRGPPASRSPSQPASLQKDQRTTDGELRSRLT